MRRRTLLLRYAAAPCAVIACSLCLTGTATAANFWWYGENNSTCWQTGQPGSPSQACDSVGAGYLSVPGKNAGGLEQMVEGGVAADLGLGISGDYCNYYRLGDQLTTPDATNEGPSTGFTTPTPYSSYQEGDAYENVCQAAGAKWGQEVRKAAPANGCWETCGMQHYESFASQGTNDRPWSRAFGSPVLVTSVEANQQVFSYAGTDVGAWGYTCPLLEDTVTGGVLEYCIQEWRSKYNTAEWGTEHIGTCASAGGKSVDTVIALIATGTRFLTAWPGSESSHVLEVAGNRHYEAGITTANLENAVRKDNEVCKRGLSTAPQNYALIGVENGIEGWRQISELAGSTGNLKLRTEYTPVAPSTPWTFRDPSTGNQYIFLRGADGALWEDRWTASEGWKLFRIGGEVVGQPTGYIQSSGDINIFYRGTDNAIWQYYYDHNTGAWHETRLGGSAAGRPQGYVEPSGEQNIFYRGTDGKIWQWYWSGSTGWRLIELGGSAAGDPYGYWNNGGQNIFFRGTDGKIWQWYWASTSGWHLIELGGSAAGDPQGYVQPNGTQNVFYRTTEGTVGQWWWASSSGWHNSPLGGSVQGNPFGIIAPNGVQHVYYHSTNGTIWEWYWEEASGWHDHELGEGAETDPVAFAQPNNNLNVYFFEAGTQAIDQWFFNGTWNISTVCAGPCG